MATVNSKLTLSASGIPPRPLDVGARTIEINRVEYMIRGLGLIRNVADIEQTVVKVNDNVPIYLRNVAHVGLGPAARRGALDKGGAEAVGGVVVVRYGANPLAVIQRVKDKIDDSVIALQLVPDSFTLSELQRVHERILGTQIDKRNFRKKVKALDLLTLTGDEKRDGPHRPAKLYRAKDPRDVPYR